MDVTKDTFKAYLPLIKEAVDEADFIAIDTELTGLHTQITEHAFDTMKERYQKLRQNCSQFLIIQFGLSAFKYIANKNKFVHKDYNFYIFPFPHIRKAPDPKFMCQASSLHFLAEQNFDFNKVIYEGISYLTHSDEESLKDYLENKHKNEQENIINKTEQKAVSVPSEHQGFINDIKKRVEKFLSNDAEKVLKLDPCNSFRRKLIYQEIQNKHPSGIELSTRCNDQNQTYITLTKMTTDEKEYNLKVKQESEMVDLDTAIGFRKVIDFISQSKKPIIGHNMLLDVMHTLNQFVCTIPESLEEFKELVHYTFPTLIDTKTLASCNKLREYFNSTVLSDFLAQFQSPSLGLPVIEAADGYKGYDLKDRKYHDAGFDAFMTGVSYLGLCKKLGSLSNEHEYPKIASKLLKPFLNRIFVMRHYDIPFLNLQGPDPEPKRDNVFYVTFPKEWKTADLVELFISYGDIYINWLDDSSALINLKNVENIEKVKKELLSKVNKIYCVTTYDDYQATCGNLKSISNSTKTSISQSEIKKRAVENSESENNHQDSAEKDQPLTKKQKISPEENQEQNTSKIFEEDNNW